jgi:hypothetical protein
MPLNGCRIRSCIASWHLANECVAFQAEYGLDLFSTTFSDSDLDACFRDYFLLCREPVSRAISCLSLSCRLHAETALLDWLGKMRAGKPVREAV